MSRVTAVGSTTAAPLTTQGDGGGGQEQPDEEQAAPAPKKETPKAAVAGGAPSRDTLERKRRPTGVPAGGPALSAGLAVEGEGQTAPAQQLAILQQKLDEAKSAFEFMGTGHPEYEKTKREVERLKQMVRALTGQPA